MSRTNIPVHDDTHARLAELKGEDETWDECLGRLADAVDGNEDCMQIVRISAEQVDEIAEMAASKVENRMTHR